MTPHVSSIRNHHRHIIRENAHRASTMHGLFLEMQNSALEQIETLIDLQLISAGAQENGGGALQPDPAPLFDTRQMQEFATGSMAKCFGPEFNIYEGRRHPRIPNGDLMLMSRAVEIIGERGHFEKPASIVTEFDAPADAWFYRENSYPSIPYSVLMEISLQPCGFLAAYLGTNLLFPNIDFYFRNLDGNAQFLNDLDLRGKRITCKAQLLSTVKGDDTVIQNFKFELSSQGITFFKGGSIFGFFTPEAMAKQVGLDGGDQTQPLYERNDMSGTEGKWFDILKTQPGQNPFAAAEHGPFYRLAGGQLNFLDKVFVSAPNLDSNHDYIYAVKNNDSRAWFYPCHFFQDPVMPGSLGVEAILQAMQTYALARDLGKQFASPRFGLVLNQPLVWKYRGQILQKHRQMKLEVNITRVEQSSSQVIVEGNASLWADAVRIYEIKRAAISLQKG